MGQYYIPCLLKKNYKTNKKPIKGALCAHKFGNSKKLMDHSYVGNGFVKAATYMLLGNETNRFVWCGDYADPIKDDKNMYQFAREDNFDTKYTNQFLTEECPDLDDELFGELKYIINHSKKQYVVVEDYKENEWQIHPLPLLTADGNGRGGGDFYGSPEDMVGIWAYDIIECNDGAPDDYERIEITFKE